MKYSVIIPCYNEEASIHALVARLSEATGTRNVEYILVDNGSRDHTGEALLAACAGREGFSIVTVPQNKGYGFGLICGLSAATGDYVGWLHADLQIDPEYMMQFINAAEEGGAYEKRFYKGIRKGRCALDRFFTAAMTLYASAMLGTWLYDIGAIPVLFSRELLKELNESTPYDFSIETYAYYTAKKNGFLIKRAPVLLAPRINGQSSWDKGFRSKVRQSRIILSDLVRIRRGMPVR